MKLIFYFGSNRLRSDVVLAAWTKGLARFGLTLPVKPEHRYAGVEADVAIMYGLWGNNRQALKDYAAAGRTAVLVDLGYWGRLDGGKLFGFHRLSVNATHPTAYVQRVKHPADRWAYFNRVVKPPRPAMQRGQAILLCGMSSKAAWVYGLGAEEWEKAAVKCLRVHSDREICYRPKPSWKEAEPIAGTTWAFDKGPLERALETSWAVVTHHGNASLDALLEGVPALCADGPASLLCSQGFEAIEVPRQPDAVDVEQLCRDVAYTQYKVDEIAEGKAWRYLLEEGLVC